MPESFTVILVIILVGHSLIALDEFDKYDKEFNR